MIISADLAERIKSGRAVTGGITIKINVNDAGMDADQLAQLILCRIAARLRTL